MRIFMFMKGCTSGSGTLSDPGFLGTVGFSGETDWQWSSSFGRIAVSGTFLVGVAVLRTTTGRRCLVDTKGDSAVKISSTSLDDRPAIN